MPYKIRKMPNKECYKVTNSITGRVHSLCTSKVNAEKQIKLLHMLDHAKMKSNK